MVQTSSESHRDRGIDDVLVEELAVHHPAAAAALEPPGAGLRLGRHGIQSREVHVRQIAQLHAHVADRTDRRIGAVVVGHRRAGQVDLQHRRAGAEGLAGRTAAVDLLRAVDEVERDALILLKSTMMSTRSATAIRTLVTCTAFGSRLPSVLICQNGRKLVPSHSDHSHQRDGPGA